MNEVMELKKPSEVKPWVLTVPFCIPPFISAVIFSLAVFLFRESSTPSF